MKVGVGMGVGVGAAELFFDVVHNLFVCLSTFQAFKMFLLVYSRDSANSFWF